MTAHVEVARVSGIVKGFRSEQAMRLLIAAALLLCLSGNVWAAIPEALAGRWSGAVARVGAENGGEAMAELGLEASGAGFALTFDLPEWRLGRAALTPTERPEVFEVAGSDGGLFGMFAGDKRANPLDGEPLTWARRTASGLVVYRLRIEADGGATLRRLALEAVDGGLKLQLEQRVDGGPPARWRGVLARAG